MSTSRESIEGEVSSDSVAERMGEDSVMAMTSGEDETDAERGDADGERTIERALRDGSLFDELPEDDDDEDEDGDEARVSDDDPDLE